MPYTFVSARPLKYWDGNEWEQPASAVQMWNGTAWQYIGLRPYADRLRFTTPYTGLNGSKFNVASRASSGNFDSVVAFFALRADKSSDFGGTSVTVWNTTGATAGDTPAMGTPFGWGPNSWATSDTNNSEYEAAINITDFQPGGGTDSLIWGNPGNYQTITGTGFTSYYPLSSVVFLDMSSTREFYASGQLFIRNIANPSISISTSWYLECNNNQ